MHQINRELRKRRESNLSSSSSEMSKDNEVASFATLVRAESQENYGGLANPQPSDTSTKITEPQIDSADMQVFGSSDLDSAKAQQAEPSLVLFFQVVFPFLIAGFGMVLAGLLLDRVQHWPLFKNVPEMFILVPALLGLKGNLEMTLASRLSTQANTGRMDTRDQVTSVAITNMALIQSQAIIVTFLAAGAAMLLAWVPRGQLDFGHAALITASSLTTASLASFILSTIMIIVVLVSRRYNINPDNISTPLAASLGDLTTLAILSVFGSLFLTAHNSNSWLNVGVIIMFVLALPAWISVAKRDFMTLEILKNGWSPIIFSMLISSSGGFVLETAIRRFPQMALFQPVINGVGGNLAAVHASRLSTFFHQNSQLGKLPFSWTLNRFYSFSRAFFSSDWDARSARVLLFLVVPGHMFFNFLIAFFHTGDNPPSSALFLSLYILAALTQVAILLFVCQWLVALMFAWKIDPDNSVIPWLTALGDLLGTSLLYCAFLFLSYVKHDQIKHVQMGSDNP
ncbi:Solute carrier family 41 member 1 [Aphelenchoides besseyi]|nr:Solute carrier family 41 member 1 [Aphelenchoides besseyi]